MAKNTPVPVDQPMRLVLFASSLMAFLIKVLPASFLLCVLSFTLAPSANAQITVQNLTEAYGDSSGVGPSIWKAGSFTTDGSSSSYQLGSITYASDGIEGTPSGFELRLYSDITGAPGSLLETLSGTTNPETEGANYIYTSSGTTLNANTTYWVVASASVGTFYWSTTDSTDETNTGGGNWSIGDNSSFSTDSGLIWFNTGTPVQFSVSTAAVPEPSTYAAILGACALGFVCYRRYRSKRVA